MIDEKIDNLFHFYLSGDDYHLYYTDAINILTNTYMDSSEADLIGYGWDVEIRSTCPIIPKGFDDFELINQHLKVD